MNEHDKCVNAVINELERGDFVGRIWRRDHTVWSSEAEEVIHGVEWLNAIDKMKISIAHEFFHAVQYGYNGWESGWLLESTAVWMEEDHDASEVGEASEEGEGCAFAPRCRYGNELCQQEIPVLEEVAGAHLSACHHKDEVKLKGV